MLGYGIGIVVGVGLTLLAIAIARPESEASQPNADGQQVTATPRTTEGSAATPVPGVQTRTTARVYIGPGEAYAEIGTIASNEEVDVLGRDDDGEWIAITFPPNSRARGWLKATDLDGLTPAALSELELLGPTPLAQAVATPGATGAGVNSSPGAGATVAPTAAANNGVVPAPSATSAAANTPTPGPNTGPTDLVVSRLFVDSDGRISAVIGNRGPGDLLGASVFVRVRDLGAGGETLIFNGDIEAGDTVTLTTTSFRLTSSQIIGIVDPGGALNDPIRDNNSLTVSLALPVTPTPDPADD